MIKLSRSPIPSPLREQCEERAAELREFIQRGETPPDSLLSAYRNPVLKSHIVAESHGKCMYCESKVTHTYWGDVEHIRPKSRFPEERLDPSNLGYACAICNNGKGEYWDPAVPLVDPYTDDPDQEFLALGFFIARRPNRDRARLTIEKLDLNRMALMERRRERIEALASLADQYQSAPIGPIRDLLRNELVRQGAVEGEYSLIVREYLRAACGVRVPEAI